MPENPIVPINDLNTANTYVGFQMLGLQNEKARLLNADAFYNDIMSQVDIIVSDVGSNVVSDVTTLKTQVANLNSVSANLTIRTANNSNNIVSLQNNINTLNLATCVVPESYGAIGNGIADDTAAFIAAYNSLPATGGTIRLSRGKRYVIGELPPFHNCTIEGDASSRGNLAPNLMATTGTVIICDPTKNRQMGNNQTWRNIRFDRSGLVWFPNDATNYINANYTGQALYAAASFTDGLIEDCIFLGFNWAFNCADTGVNVSRLWFYRNRIDCLNGIKVTNSYDVTKIYDNHFWPFTTLGSPTEPNNRHHKRPGTAIKLVGANDWTKIKGNFIYYYQTGIQCTDAGYVYMDDNGADHYGTGSNDGSIGILVDGAAFDIRINNTSIHGPDWGIQVSTTSPNGRVTIRDELSAEAKRGAVYLTSGRVIVRDPLVRYGGLSGQTANYGGGIFITGAASELTLSGGEFKGLGAAIQVANGGKFYYEGGSKFINCTSATVGVGLPVIASADPLIIDSKSVAYTVTGNTSFGTLSSANQFIGKTVTLQFTDSIKVFNNGTIKLAANTGSFWQAANGSTITLLSVGNTWVEVARTA